MQLGNIGSRILGAGIVALVVGYALNIVWGGSGNVMAGIGAVGVALGAAALCISPGPRSRGKISRFGLGVLAVGLGCLIVSAIIAAGMTFDPLESWPVVLFGFAGIVLTPIGLLVTLLAQVRRLALSRG